MRWTRWLLGTLLTTVILIGAVTWWIGSELVAPANHAVQKPTGLAAQDVSIPGNGHAIAGWWADTRTNAPVVLLLHGVRADRTAMASRAALLAAHGFSTLSIDLQAHGETPGAAITLGWRESADVVSALAWIRANAPERKVGIVGISLGGASALLAPQPIGADALVLEAVYPRIGLAVTNRVRMRLGDAAPWLSPLLLWQLEPRLHIAPADLEPIRSIGKVSAPVLIVAGSDDEHTTLIESRELYEAAAEPKAFWEVRGAKHQDFLRFDPNGYETHVIRFLDENLGGS